VTQPTSLTSSMTWNCTGGVQSTATDPNNWVTTWTYNDSDAWRPTQVSDTGSSIPTNLWYWTGPTAFESTQVLGSGTTVEIIDSTDSLG
jgi:hypothetical protein